jgi:hypothetical protein
VILKEGVSLVRICMAIVVATGGGPTILCGSVILVLGGLEINTAINLRDMLP